MKRVLLHVYIDTHFIELIRVARLLKDSKRYDITFFFEYHYGAIERDLKIAFAEGFVCLDKAGNPFTTPGVSVPPPAARNKAPVEAASALTYDVPVQPAPGFRARMIAHWLAFKIRYPKVHRSTALAPLVFTARFFFKTLSAIRCAISWVNLLARIHPEIPGQIIYFYHQAKLARKLIAENRPDVVILPESNIAYATASLTRAAHRRKVPVLIVPFTIANASELAEAYWHNPDYGMGPRLNRFVAKWFPKWVLTYKERRILPVRSAQIIAMELFRLSPPLPWIINSGDIDAIAVESDRMRDYYLQAGLPALKLAETGTLADDILFRGKEHVAANRARLFDELGLSGELPLLLCALTPDQIRTGREGCDFSNYADLTDFWLKTLADVRNYNVIVKLHPRMKIEDFSFIERYGLKISQLDTADLIPLCDLYVTSVSATIRWAISCAKPVLNYDVYRFRYQDFSDVKGVITVEEKQDFIDTLKRLCNDEVFLAETISAQALEAPRWANLDGRSSTRMLQFIDAYTHRYPQGGS
jgi:hypothetical protein